MRHYPKNSSRAAARIVAFVLLADGHLSRSELNALRGADCAQQLGLDPADMEDLLQEVAHDLLATGTGLWDGGGRLDADVVAGALADVDDPALQRRVMEVGQRVVRADGHLSEGEQAVLSAAASRWGMEAPVHG